MQYADEIDDISRGLVVRHDEDASLSISQKDRFMRELKGLSPEQQIEFFEMLDSYISVPSELIDDYLNKTIEVLGCLIEEIPESVNDDGEVLKGYHQVLVKINEESKKGHHTVIRISTRKMLQKAEMWEELWGKGDWKKPVHMKVYLNGKQKLLQMVAAPKKEHK